MDRQRLNEGGENDERRMGIPVYIDASTSVYALLYAMTRGPKGVLERVLEIIGAKERITTRPPCLIRLWRPCVHKARHWGGARGPPELSGAPRVAR